MCLGHLQNFSFISHTLSEKSKVLVGWYHMFYNRMLVSTEFTLKYLSHLLTKPVQIFVPFSNFMECQNMFLALFGMNTFES